MDEMLTPKERMQTFAHAYLLSGALCAAAELGIADLLWEKPEQTIEQLSAALNVDSRSLFRLLRYLVSHRVFSQSADGAFSLNPEAAYLSEKHPESIRGDLLVTPGPRWNAFGAIREAVVHGRPAFDLLYGKSYFHYLSENPEAANRFNIHMTSYTQGEDRLLAPLLPVEEIHTLMDIGGGEGHFLNEALRCFSHVNGILFDLESAVSNPQIQQDQKRWKVYGGSFFEPLPQTDADAYILKRVLHNWSDEDSLKILRNISLVMKEGSRLWIIEGVVPENNSRHQSKDTDLFLMTLFPGCERTEGEFRELANQAGFQITRILPTPTFLSIIELRK